MKGRSGCIGLVVGGTLASVVGLGLMMSSVCYEECDPNADRRMGAGAIVIGAATVAVVTGAILWIRNHHRETQIEDQVLSESTWNAAR